MAIEIEAIYKKGVLKPLKKLKLKEGEKVKIKIEKTIGKNFYENLKKLEKKAPKVYGAFKILEEMRK